jgi:signal transduction histidine kinase
MRTGTALRAGVLRRVPALANEVILVAVLAALQVAVTVSVSGQVSGDRPIDALAIALLVLGPLATPARHAHPAIPVAICVAALTIYTLRNYWLGPVFLSFAAVLILTELAGRSTIARVGAASVVAMLVGCLISGAGSVDDAPQVFGITAWMTVIIAVTAQVRVRREAGRQRAERLAEESRRIASEGRLELARDLHDVLAHSLSVINVQAGVALHLIDSDPEQVRSALSIIKSTSRSTLAEVRDALNSLRGADGPPVTATVGLHDLDRLVDSARPSGLQTTVEVTGTRCDLPSRVDIAAYRIVQESLTNITKHSAAKSAHVLLNYEPDALVLTVADPGPTQARSDAALGGGHGINGMRERVADLGGELTAGRRFDGSFVVHAQIPVRAES